jgi:predicted transcriptional regulator
MTNKNEQKIYEMLSDEPLTPSEIAQKLKIAYKTAQRALMHLALTKEDVGYRNSGRIHIFWKKSVKEGS